MNAIRCLAVDDEPLALDLLMSYADQVQECTLTCVSTPLEARQLLLEQDFDGLFLDIRMPQMTGFELLSTLPSSPPVVVTSAYDNHALQSFSYNVVDYLLKPISFASFLRACNRLSQGVSQLRDSAVQTPVQPTQRVYVQVDGVLRRILHQDIHYVQASGVYVEIHVVDGSSMLVRDTMAHCGEVLGSSFARIHKSYIVPLARIESLDSNMVVVDGITLPVGRSYKDELLAALHNNKLG